MKTMEVKSVLKNTATPIELGLSDRMDIKDIQTIRGETNEMEQRPKSTPSTIKSDKGTFEYMG